MNAGVQINPNHERWRILDIFRNILRAVKIAVVREVFHIVFNG